MLKRHKGRGQEGILEEEEEDKSVAWGVFLFSSLAKVSPQDSLEYLGGGAVNRISISFRYSEKIY